MSGGPIVSAPQASATAQARKRWVQSTGGAAAALQGQGRVQLSRVLGHSVAGPLGASYHPVRGGTLAYVAGGVGVVYDHRSDAQTRLLVGRRGRDLALLQWSADGDWIVAGEKGNNAAVLVFNPHTGARIATIFGHDGSITCAKLSPLKDFLVVVSEEQPLDGSPRSNVGLWRLSDRQLVWSHTGEQVCSLDWSADNTYFVMGGKHYMRFAYLRAPVQQSSTSLNADPAYVRPLLDVEVREGRLVKNEKAEFVAVVCGQGALSHCVFALSRHGQGVVCVFTLKEKGVGSSAEGRVSSSGGAAPTSRWEIEKWMDVRMPDAAVLSVQDDVLAVGGGESKLRVFVASSLKHVDTLPKPAPLLHDRKAFPALVAATLCAGGSSKLAAVYSDRTLVVWDISKKPATVFRTIVAHSGPVWGLALPPPATPATGPGSQQKRRRGFHDADYDSEEEEAAAAEAAKRNEGRLAEGSFATCGSDNTIRVWNANSAAPGSDCTRTVYVAPIVQNGSVFPPSAPVPPASASASTSGIRSLCFLPPREAFSHGLLASGDKSGYVRLHNLADWKQLTAMEIHDSEVRCLDFHAAPSSGPSASASANAGGLGVASLPLLLSGGRDTTVHVHNTHNPVVTQTFTPDVAHTRAVTSVKVVPPSAPTGAEGASQQTQLQQQKLVYLTSGLDKQVCIHTLGLERPDRVPAPDSVELVDEVVATLSFPTSCVLDIVVHPTGHFAAVLLNNTEKKAQAAAAAAPSAPGSRLDSRPVNCVIQMIDLASLVKSRAYSIQSLGNGEPLCMSLDPSGMLLSVAFNDKSILLVDWYSGAVLTAFHGHGQSVTGMVFTHDCRTLVTTGRDGCVMLWSIDRELVRAMQTRRRERCNKNKTAGAAGKPASAKSTALALLGSSDEEDEESEDEGGAGADKEQGEGAAATGAPVPPLSNGGTSPKASGALSNRDYRPRVLPSWARSTVVSPENSSAADAAHAAMQLLASPSSSSTAAAVPGAGIGFGLGLGAGGVERSGSLSGASGGVGAGVARGRWAQRVEVDASGQPIVPVADSDRHKVYGELGTIGVGTMLLDAEDDDEDQEAAPGSKAGGGGGSVRVSRDDDEGLEGDADADGDDEEIEEEEDLSEESAESVAPGADDPASSGGGGGINLRSSLTARHFQKLREEGKMPGGGAGSGAGAGAGTGSQQKRDALRLPSSFHEREAKTTTETQQIRAQLRSMGVLDGGGEGAPLSSPVRASPAASPSADQPASASASAAVGASAAAAAPVPSPRTVERAESDAGGGAASLESSSQSTFVSAESEPSLAMEHAHIPFSTSLTSAALLPPLPNSPDPPASTSAGSSAGASVALPQLTSPPRGAAQSQSQSQSLTSDPSLRASMQALPSQIAQFQSSLQRMLEGFGAVRHALDSRPATATSSGASSSSALVRASAVRPTLPPAAIQSVSVSLSFAPSGGGGGGDGSGGSSSPPGSATLPFVSPAALEGSMDLDTLEAVYEAQLDTMEALLAQARPQRRLAAQTQQPQPQPQQLLIGSGSSGAAPSLPMLLSDPTSPSSQHTFLTEASMSPSQQALSLQQSAAITAQLSEMRQMLQRIEATTLTTTQQLSLGLTLSGPNAMPTNAFSRADSK